MFYLIAQSNNAKAGAQIVENTFEQADVARKALATLWGTALQGPLFWGVSQAGALIAALFIAFWVVVWVKKNVHSEYPVGPENMGALLLALFLVALLFSARPDQNNLLGRSWIGLNEFGNYISDVAIRGLSTIPVDDSMIAAQRKQSVQIRADSDFKRCSKLPGSVERDQCLLESADRVKNSLGPYLDRDWAKDLNIAWQRKFIYATTIPGNYLPIPATGKADFDLGVVVNSAVSKSIVAALWLLVVAFLMALGYFKLITAVVSPIFIGLSFVSLERDLPVLKVVRGFVTLILVEITFKVLIGFVSQIIVNSPPQDPLIMPLLLTIFGIPFAFVLARGGGSGLFAAALGTVALLRR